MKFTHKLLPLLAILAASNASATNGYFAHGYGVKSQGMGGIGIATRSLQQQPTRLAWV